MPVFNLLIPSRLIAAESATKTHGIYQLAEFVCSELLFKFFMVLGIYQVTYSDRKFCRSVLSVCPGFASLGISR